MSRYEWQQWNTPGFPKSYEDWRLFPIGKFGRGGNSVAVVRKKHENSQWDVFIVNSLGQYGLAPAQINLPADLSTDEAKTVAYLQAGIAGVLK